jgi:predicted RNase H-like HicB family nuclease/DNA-binding XRE family transcriptional regulator
MKTTAFSKLTASSSAEEIAAVAALYTRVITWSEEDEHFVGALPEIDGVCTYASSVEQCAANLQECAEIALEDYLLRGLPLNPPQTCTILPPSRFRNGEATNEQIAGLRRRLGFSQTAFAAALGVTPSTVRHWEHGNRRPDGASARLLSIAEKHPEVLCL